MARHAWPVGLSLLVVLPGCLQLSDPTALAPPSPFGGATATSSRLPQNSPVAPAATAEAAKVVARVGRNLVAANPSLGFSPMFVTVGGDSAPPELFHRGETEVVITESLARKCKTDAELAALLSRELGNMASERAGTALAEIADRGPPPEVKVGNDYGGNFGPADGTRMMELAKYERKRALAREQSAPPDPNVLARAYLRQAGFDPGELDRVAPLLAAADGNNRFEKQMTQTPAK